MEILKASDSTDSAPSAASDSPTPTRAISQGVTARNVTQLVPGLITSLLETVGCKLPSRYDVYAAARMTYRPDGRPQAIGIDSAQVTPACGDAVKVLAYLSRPRLNEPVVPGRSVWLLLPVERSIVACIDAKDPAPVRIGDAKGVTAPRKIKHVNPPYPPAALNDRVQGLVLIEALISTTGCVKSAEVIRRVHIALDIEALRSVSQWRFEPTLVGGTPLPVIMTVSVNFTLQ